VSRECVDIFHLHNAITEAGGGEALSARQVLDDVVPAFERLWQQGKTRFLGLTAIGDTTALRRVIDARAFDSAQVVYTMLKSVSGHRTPVELSCTGLWPAVRSYDGGGGRHPRPGGRLRGTLAIARSWSAGSPRTISLPTAPQPKPSTEWLIPVRPNGHKSIDVPPRAPKFP
jgi:hypothetical protein